jgi:hypothetical protein
MVDSLFPLDGGRRGEGKKKEKEKNLHGEEGFPRVGLTLLAVQWVTAVRCN